MGVMGGWGRESLVVQWSEGEVLWGGRSEMRVEGDEE